MIKREENPVEHVLKMTASLNLELVTLQTLAKNVL
jgi:hypothetical protein